MQLTQVNELALVPGADPVITPQQLEWQKRLLPLMAGTLALLTVFFCASLTYETISVQKHIESAHEINLNAQMAKLERASESNSAAALAEFRTETASILEANVIERRYHQASAAAMGRIYLIFLGFATGMVLALSGTTFILGKLKEDETAIGGEGPSFKANLRSGSPGLILAFFGLLLMMSTIFSRVDIDVRDQALYLGSGAGSAGMDMFSSPNKEAIASPKDILQSKVKPALTAEPIQEPVK